MDDRILLQRAKKGSAGAFEKLVQTYERGIYALCLRMTGNHEDAQDMTQETLIRAWQHIRKFDGQAAFYTWLYRIAVNVCLDELRRRKRRRIVSMENVPQNSDGIPEKETPEMVAQNAELGDVLKQLLLRLNEEQRLVVILRDVQGFSYEQIAQMLSLNLNTVKSRISRGRQNLRDWIGQNTELFDSGSV